MMMRACMDCRRVLGEEAKVCPSCGSTDPFRENVPRAIAEIKKGLLKGMITIGCIFIFALFFVLTFR